MTIKVEHLSKKYGENIILQDVGFKTMSGSLLTLIGPSGAGKSTLVRILAGLDTNVFGQIEINQHKIPLDNYLKLRLYRRKNAIVFQQHNLLPHLNVINNIIFPLIHVFSMKTAQATSKAIQLLERFQLLDHINKYPHQLSGGQSQRIALCRAMVVQPEILFLDEPTSSLDPEMTYEVLQMIAELQATGTNIIMVTHNIAFAIQAASHFLFVANKKVVYYNVEEIKNYHHNIDLANFLKYAML